MGWVVGPCRVVSCRAPLLRENAKELRARWCQREAESEARHEVTECNVADADADEDEDVREDEGELGWGLGLGIYMGTVLTVDPTRLWCLGALAIFSLGVFTAPLIPDQGQNWRSGAARDSDRVLWHVIGLAEKHH